MHIPPYYKKPGWQRFFVGAFFGGLIAYLIVIFMYGTMYEQLLQKNLHYESELKDLKNQNEALLKDNENLDEKTKEPMKVESIELEITNEEELKIKNSLTSQKLKELVKEEINQIIGLDIQTVADSEKLLIAAIENKLYTLDDFSYSFTVSFISISQEVKLKLNATISN